MEPLAFAVIMGFIAGIIHALLRLPGMGYGAGYGGGMMGGFGTIIVMPIIFAISSFIGAAILFLIWKLMGSQEEYEAAYRCGAYLAALAPITAIIGVVPYAGGLITMAIYTFYLVAASVHVHNIPSQKAWLVFGIIGAIFALLGVLSEYKVRNMTSSMNELRKTSEEYREAAREMKKSTEELRKQTEEMAKKYQRQAEEAQKRNQ